MKKPKPIALQKPQPKNPKLILPPNEQRWPRMLVQTHPTITGYDFTVDTPLPIKRAVRSKCVECMGGERNRAATCENVDCTLWPYRPGTKTTRKCNLTPEQRAAVVERFADARAKQKEEAHNETD